MFMLLFLLTVIKSRRVVPVLPQARDSQTADSSEGKQDHQILQNQPATVHISGVAMEIRPPNQELQQQPTEMDGELYEILGGVIWCPW